MIGQNIRQRNQTNTRAKIMDKINESGKKIGQKIG